MFFSVTWIFSVLSLATTLNAWPAEDAGEAIVIKTCKHCDLLSILKILNQNKKDTKLKNSKILAKQKEKAPHWGETLPSDKKLNHKKIKLKHSNILLKIKEKTPKSIWNEKLPSDVISDSDILNQDTKDLKLKYSNIISKVIEKLPQSIWDKTSPSNNKDIKVNKKITQNIDNSVKAFVKYLGGFKITKIKSNLNSFGTEGDNNNYKYNFFDPSNQDKDSKNLFGNDEGQKGGTTHIKIQINGRNSNPNSNNNTIFYDSNNIFSNARLDDFDRNGFIIDKNSLLNPISMYNPPNDSNNITSTIFDNKQNDYVYNKATEDDKTKIDPKVSKIYNLYLKKRYGITRTNNIANQPNGNDKDDGDNENTVKKLLDNAQNEYSKSYYNTDKDYNDMINFYLHKKPYKNQNDYQENDRNVYLSSVTNFSNKVFNRTIHPFEDGRKISEMGNCCLACREAFRNACKKIDCSPQATRYLAQECSTSCKRHFQDQDCSF